jgi:arachidonate 15-lipoxygenase
MLPHELARRGVADPELFPGYPYRDDALLLWAAIEGWVRDYLCIYYNDDAALVSDVELQAWYRDLVSSEGGGIGGLGEPGPDGETGLFTLAYLTEVVTMVIFTASVQHAAVNFPQKEIMSYTPAMPLATYSPPPTRVSGPLSANTALVDLPPLQMSFVQLLVGQLLGGVYFTRLGDYDRHQRAPWFGDPRVEPGLEAFQADLREVERTIGARNLARPCYEFLLPSRIPQSINI